MYDIRCHAMFDHRLVDPFLWGLYVHFGHVQQVLIILNVERKAWKPS